MVVHQPDVRVDRQAARRALTAATHNPNSTYSSEAAKGPGEVLKGYAQREHIDYEETSAPVGKLETFRYLMALANRKDWNLRQIDFKNAFLNAKMDKELYMDIPPGMEFLSYGPQNPCRRNGLQID
jgi:hypothetical protein